MSEIKLLLADKQDLSRAGLKALIAQHTDLKIVDEVKSKAHLIEALNNTDASLLILDYNLADFVSVEDLLDLQTISPKTRLLIISSDNDKDNIKKALESGINGYVTKECSQEEIVGAIRATSKGQKFFCNKVLDVLLEKNFQKEEEDCEPTNLSKRETEILKLIAEGNSTIKIADKLNLSHHTINTHRKNILKKLNAKSPAELVIYAINTGIITPK
ncbi:response regulator transcription factor [Fulvivirgaceae bacterium BMA10]|uniref:Response regulator transcription factor n=1 Tax=Splendidivirga corallicola TaxID=3051826 RepID=A0ABT8KYA4_9BACT|nr:response regulator transcription factor [Fulvivirgaceae bacterium BMA10]